MENVAQMKNGKDAILHMQTSVMGKVLRVDRHQGFIYTSIICPAIDEFSKPEIVKIKSKQMIGITDEVLKSPVVCIVGGYQKKAYKNNDGESIIPVDITLTALE
uniref:Putative single-stranded DNA-binding protein n=1 Tax=viral metagenome TaxID=1070528 RepID=A0A6H1Z747_9ZZZZ